ncbi:MAG TPA: hypothetical protein DCY13_22995 [Verrucomicrobiales bacterium]|nr:hypothetical protein [Verrucomicrobiales bacterium]
MISTEQARLLSELQQRIERYQPILEEEFDVNLGKVVARPFGARAWLRKMRDRSLVQASRRGGFGLNRRLMLRCEWALIYLPACFLVWFRHWYPQFMMRWDDDEPAILVPFRGWMRKDHRRRIAQLDQWAVHEMAHGIWHRIADDSAVEHGRRWRVWNEGFAHYVADVHLRPHYPAGAIIDEEWSPMRLEGRRLVAKVVDHHGAAMLKRVPRDWRQHDRTIDHPV